MFNFLFHFQLTESDNYAEQHEAIDKDLEQEKEPVFEPEFVKETDFEQAKEPEFSQQSIPIFEQEKEPEFVEEERQAQDDIEKDLQLTVEIEESDEMSQLNPDAAEFIPISPIRTSGMMSPPINPINQVLNNIAMEDQVVSQSPRKGDFNAMEDDDVTVPSEKDFDCEADNRPHEFDLLGETGGFERIESPEGLNLKESLQQDDKLAQEYKDEAQPFFEENVHPGDDYKVLESSFIEYSNGFQNVIDDPMNRSFYEGRDGDILNASASATDLLNTVQPIPTFEDEQPEADHQNVVVENEKPEADLMGTSAEYQQELKVEVTKEAPMEASSDHFEAESFVEEIKGAQSESDKYVDQGLSPSLPDFSPNTIQTVQETIMVENPSLEPVQDTNLDTFITDTSTVPHVQAPEEPQVEAMIELKDIPEGPAQVEVVPTPEPEKIIEQVEPVKEEPKVETINEVIMVTAAAAAVGTLVGAGSAAKKKPATAKAEVKKADVKAKAPVKTNPVPAKRAPATTATKAPAARPVTSAAPTKTALVAKKPAPKPLASSAPISRPKPATSTLAPAKKPASATAAKTVTEAAKPAPISRAGALATALAKRPTTSVATTKWEFK